MDHQHVYISKMPTWDVYCDQQKLLIVNGLINYVTSAPASSRVQPAFDAVHANSTCAEEKKDRLMKLTSAVDMAPSREATWEAGHGEIHGELPDSDAATVKSRRRPHCARLKRSGLNSRSRGDAYLTWCSPSRSRPSDSCSSKSALPPSPLPFCSRDHEVPRRRGARGGRRAKRRHPSSRTTVA
jgi:hypothetical protein